MSLEWRKRTWIGLVDTVRDGHYLYLISSRAQRKYLRFLGLAGLLAAISTGLNLVPDISGTLIQLINAALGIGIIAILLWIIQADYSRTSIKAGNAAGECTALARQWRRLFAKIENLDDDEALDMIEDLEAKAIGVTSFVPEVLGIDDKLNKESAEYTNVILQQEYEESPAS